ncbi:hypothetical protein GOBAR_AA13409 [Gossypium barbadense]|uniref:Uncharacterized protein n=1 Tax=Gossypium barbadense TaxID=3634 RepID=A0A2P5XV60_GOSBA|nr:hypothetical protein GOBAR_AA13409 [Gossypium barbadense]
MASFATSNIVVLCFVVLVSWIHFNAEARRLGGNISVNLIWYGNFKPSQRAIVSDFINSLASSKLVSPQPSVATWWKAMDKYYHLTNKSSSLVISLGSQILNESYFLGKSLTNEQILQLASKGSQRNPINVVLTSVDVAVEGFCSSKCGTHGHTKSPLVSTSRSVSASKSSRPMLPLMENSPTLGTSVVFMASCIINCTSSMNSETQCPGRCVWPFHQPIYRPQNPSLVAPNNDVGLEGMVINLATLLAGTVTNLFGNGYYQGPKEAPLEAASACPGIYGKGAYPGYAGDLPVDVTTGASYNTHGVNGRKYLLPALFDSSTSTCATLA